MAPIACGGSRRLPQVAVRGAIYSIAMPRRVLLVANHDRPEIRAVLPEFRQWLSQRATIAGEFEAMSREHFPTTQVDLAVVLGGDGTLLSQARRFVPHGIPLLGVNLGRLGFIAEFDMADLFNFADRLFAADQPLPLHSHMLIEAHVFSEGADMSAASPRERHLALNDCVITSGPPFRMIELFLTLDGEPTPSVHGDGLIVSTPIGSTAYSVSSGGSIIEPRLDCFAITPIAAHSLAFRPIIISPQTELIVTLERANAGTTMVLDGQVFAALRTGDRILIRQHGRRVGFVANPANNYWRTLTRKMHWAAAPTSK